ncbi:MAG TPA: PssD/Cps14F family polysaccharide biosynthesis glycosyltransferase [Solirubrobacterales bacterium]|nr:PssD/Cps14F family polysaccharide biosynthesis glycosyltransferase [Solirubrobacterales bacterium]
MTQTAEARPRKALLVCSPGGHLFQMLCLESAWSDLDTTWVTLEAADTDQLLEDAKVVLGRGPTNRSLRALLANFALAWRLIRRERPDAILSTGAALAFPFFLVGKLFGARLVYVESLTRTDRLSLTGRLIYPLADAFFVQWPEADRRKRTRYAGNLL